MSKLLKLCALLPMLAFTSCLDVKVETTLNEDGSGTFMREMRSPDTVNVGLFGNTDPTTAEELEQEQKEGLQKAKEKAAKAGVELLSHTVELDGKVKVVRSEIAFTDLGSLAQFDADKEETHMAFTVEGNTARFEQRFKPDNTMDPAEGAMLQQALQDSEIVFVWNFPYEVSEVTTDTGVTTLSEDKRSVTLKMNLLTLINDGMDVSVAMQKSSISSGASLAGVGLVVLLCGGLLIRFLKK